MTFSLSYFRFQKLIVQEIGIPLLVQIILMCFNTCLLVVHVHKIIYYINTSEITSELSREKLHIFTREDNMLSSHMKRSRALSLLH